MVLIPSTATFEQKDTFDRLSKPVTKTIKVWDGPNPVSFDVIIQSWQLRFFLQQFHQVQDSQVPGASLHLTKFGQPGL